MFQFRLELQSPQGVLPHVFERVSDGPQRVAPRAIEAMPVLAAAFDEPRAGERLQLEGHGPERHVTQRGVNLAGGPFAVPDEAKDLLTPGGGDGGQDGTVEHVNNLN